MCHESVLGEERVRTLTLDDNVESGKLETVAWSLNALSTCVVSVRTGDSGAHPVNESRSAVFAVLASDWRRVDVCVCVGK